MLLHQECLLDIACFLTFHITPFLFPQFLRLQNFWNGINLNVNFKFFSHNLGKALISILTISCCFWKTRLRDKILNRISPFIIYEVNALNNIFLLFVFSVTRIQRVVLVETENYTVYHQIIKLLKTQSN